MRMPTDRDAGQIRRALLDVNVLIALLDASHASHHAALSWFATHGSLGWASCPITQNGCLRIMTTPGYPNARSIAVVAERLREACAHPSHQFWADDVSLLAEDHLDLARIHGPRQLTDAYLLHLAVRHDGHLVTFDRSVPLSAVRGATPAHLLVL